MLVALVAGGLAFGPHGARAVERSCGWGMQVSGGQTNVLYTDENAAYWSAGVPMPDGAHIELSGQFPHARYQSLITYDNRLAAIDILRDTDIAADPGSSNPFLPGADRTVAERDYTVRIVRGRAPESGRAPNTLYTENAEGMKAGARVQFVLRIYVGDLGRGIAGGVPLPDVTLVRASGERFTYPQCPDTDRPNTGEQQILAAAGVGFPLPDVPPVTPEPEWHRYVGGGAQVIQETDNPITGESVYPLLEPFQPREPQGGLGDTPDARYVYTLVGADRGQVFAFRAKAPTFPATSSGEPRMGRPGQGHRDQVRYWSLCSYMPTTSFLTCTYDEQVPLDEDGYYTFVVSTAASRPRNAANACGVAWLPAGPSRTVVVLRNMVPDPSFTQSTHAARPGTEAEDMGPYYPGGDYYATTADFERLGCPADVQG